MSLKIYSFCLAVVVVGVVVVLSATGAHAVDPALRCESGKLKESARYCSCRLKAASKAVKKGVAPDFSRCEFRFTSKFVGLELKPGGALCPTLGDEPDINGRITSQTGEIATLLSGATLPTCGDASIDPGEQCDGVELAGADCLTLGFTGGALACDGSCFYDLIGCTAGGGGLVPGVDPILTATGETTAWGVGSDGDVQAGVPLAYVDNGDGTITDLNTGLMWEKKDDSGGIHDKDAAFGWSTGANLMDGPIATVFLAALNGGGGFAGYTDWRVPNVKELQSIVDYGASDPAVDPAFHQSATCTGCADVTLTTCSCTSNADYWSSTTHDSDPAFALYVRSSNGILIFADKLVGNNARAVRGGL